MSITTHDDRGEAPDRTHNRPNRRRAGGKRGRKRRIAAGARPRVRLPYWIVCCTKYKQENLAAKNLEAQGLRVLNTRYVPDNQKRGLEPLFPGYVFVQVDPYRDCGFIQNTRGIRGVLTTGSKWDKVPDEEIERLIEMQDEEEDQGVLVLPHRRKLHEGEIVEIVAGSFKSLRGVYIEDTPNERIRMLFEFMGKQVAHEIDRHKVKPV